MQTIILLAQVLGFRRVLVLLTSVLVFTSRAFAATVGPYNGPSESYFTSQAGWSASGTVTSYNLDPRFNRLTGINYTLYGAAEVTSALIVNNSNFNEYPTVNGSASIILLDNGVNYGAAYLFPTGNTVITPHSSGTVFGIANQTVTGSLPLPANYANMTSVNPGTLTVEYGSGSGPNLQTLGSVQVSYTYTPIGLTQSDPIAPTGTSGNSFTFAGVPSGRWFDPPTTSAFEYNITSAGDSFSSVASLPSGFQGEFDVSADGIDYGLYSSGQSLTFPTGVQSFVVSDISPSVSQGVATAFPIELGFNRDGVTFTATPVSVPEPGFAPLVLLAALRFTNRRPSHRGSGLHLGVIRGSLSI